MAGLPGLPGELDGPAYLRRAPAHPRGQPGWGVQPRRGLRTLLQGKIAIITGGGSGIGRAAAVRFAREGAGVVIADINGAAGAAVADEIAGEGHWALAVQADVADLDQDRAVVDRTVEERGGLDILINVAGMPGIATRGDDFETWDAGIDQTLSSAFRASEVAVPHMAARGKGAIVNICSLAGTRSAGPNLWYPSAKAGLTGLTRSQAVKYAPNGVRANAVCFGAIDTPRYRAHFGGEAQARGALNPMRRVGAPEEAAAAILFLASDEASYITGEVLTVDGGRSVV